MLHILIYGDGQDRETLLTLMDRSQPIAHCEKRYTYLTDRDAFLHEMRYGDVDLAIFTADGEDGRSAIRSSRLGAPGVPKIWFSNDLNDAFESYELGCTWFGLKPPAEDVLRKALTRFMHPERMIFNDNDLLQQGGLPI